MSLFRNSRGVVIGTSKLMQTLGMSEKTKGKSDFIRFLGGNLRSVLKNSLENNKRRLRSWRLLIVYRGWLVCSY